MKYLIVGLGNIGDEYYGTRHNIGFEIADELVRQGETKFVLDRLAYVARVKHKGRNLILIKPTTFMNLSGKALQYWMQAEKVSIDNIMVIVDDLALPFGSIRLRGNGSDAGHNGLKSIQETLGNNNYPRLRFGIGNSYPKGRQVDYVLGVFTKEEREQLPERIKMATDAIKSFAAIGLQQSMNLFNNK